MASATSGNLSSFAFLAALLTRCWSIRASSTLPRASAASAALMGPSRATARLSSNSLIVSSPTLAATVSGGGAVDGSQPDSRAETASTTERVTRGFFINAPAYLNARYGAGFDRIEQAKEAGVRNMLKKESFTP